MDKMAEARYITAMTDAFKYCSLQTEKIEVHTKVRILVLGLISFPLSKGSGTSSETRPVTLLGLDPVFKQPSPKQP